MPFYRQSLVQADPNLLLHCIAVDVPQFCDIFAELLSSVGKPLFDMAIFGGQLMNILGYLPVSVMFITFLASARFLRTISPSFSKVASRKVELEARFRRLHSHLVSFSEEIMFYNGAKHSSDSLQAVLDQILDEKRIVSRILLAYDWVQTFITRYYWNITGLIAFAIPSLKIKGGRLIIESSGHKGQSGENFETFTIARKFMVQTADSGSRLMRASKRFAELTSCTNRVFGLLSMLHQLHSPYFFSAKKEAPPLSFKDVHGAVQEQFNGLRFENAPIIAPKEHGERGHVLCEPLTFVVKPGDHLLISGENGTGKSSVLRVISGLWPLYSGLLSKPDDSDIIYLPQKVYLPLGCLRDLVTYPVHFNVFEIDDELDSYVKEILELVHLGYLCDREDGLDAIKE